MGAPDLRADRAGVRASQRRARAHERAGRDLPRGWRRDVPRASRAAKHQGCRRVVLESAGAQLRDARAAVAGVSAAISIDSLYVPDTDDIPFWGKLAGHFGAYPRSHIDGRNRRRAQEPRCLNIIVPGTRHRATLPTRARNRPHICLTSLIFTHSCTQWRLRVRDSSAHSRRIRTNNRSELRNTNSGPDST